MSASSVKCVVVGDGFVGKTTLLMRLCQKEFDSNYTPTVFDNHLVSTVHNGQTYEIILIDTAGQEDYGMLRKQFYESVNVFLVCFAVTSIDSFSNVKEVWLPEIEECPSAAKILVGTKSDLRNDPETIDKLNESGAIFVGQTVARNFADSHKMKYTECSSVTQENVQDLTKLILDVYNASRSENNQSPSSPCCCINPILQQLKRALCCRNNY